MKVNDKKNTISVALFVSLLLMVKAVSADFTSLVSGQISRTVSQEVNKNISDKVIDGSKAKLSSRDKKLYAKTEIRQVQKLLQGLGFRTGVADGVMGGKTRKAIKAFQKSRTITADGVLTQSVLEILKEAKANK